MLAPDQVYCVDAIEGLKQLDDESVDLVITDPPYNIASPTGLTISHGKLKRTADVFGHWDQYDPFDYDLLILQALSQCYRVLKAGGSLYMFTARQDNGHFIRHAKARGFRYRDQLAIIKKTRVPSLHKTNWRNSFDVCMYLSKGKPKTFNFLSQSELVNCYHYPINHKQTNHPTEKPLQFIKRLVAVSSNPGDLVVDPFTGSGTTLVASQQLGRRFIGFDTSVEYVRMARGRLNAAAGKAA